MPLLDPYVFVDCLLVNWSVDSHLSELSVDIEAYGTPGGVRTRGLLSVRCVKLSSFESKIHPRLGLILKGRIAQMEEISVPTKF